MAHTYNTLTKNVHSDLPTNLRAYMVCNNYLCLPECTWHTHIHTHSQTHTDLTYAPLRPAAETQGPCQEVAGSDGWAGASCCARSSQTAALK